MIKGLFTLGKSHFAQRAMTMILAIIFCAATMMAQAQISVILYDDGTQNAGTLGEFTQSPSDDNDPNAISVLSNGSFVFFDTQFDNVNGPDAVILFDEDAVGGGTSRFAVIADEDDYNTAIGGSLNNFDIIDMEIGDNDDIYMSVVNTTANPDEAHVLKIPNTGGNSFGAVVEVVDLGGMTGNATNNHIAVDRSTSPDTLIVNFDNDLDSNDAVNGIYTVDSSTVAGTPASMTLLASNNDMVAALGGTGGSDAFSASSVTVLSNGNILVLNGDSGAYRRGSVVEVNGGTGAASEWLSETVGNSSEGVIDYNPTLDRVGIFWYIGTESGSGDTDDRLDVFDTSGNFVATVVNEDTIMAEVASVTGGGAAADDIALYGNALTNDGGNFYVFIGNTNESLIRIPVPTGIEGNITSIDYGSVTVGESATDATLTITNLDLLTPATISSATIDDDFSFVGLPATPFDIPANDSISVTIQFAPTTVGAHTGQASFNGSVTVDLAGVGTAAPAPDIDIATASIDFGDVWIDSYPTFDEFEIGNTGNAVLNIDDLSVAITGADAADFTVVLPTSAIALNDGATTTTRVRFIPSTPGAKMATLTVTSDDGDEGSIAISLAANVTSVQPAFVNVIEDNGSTDFGYTGEFTGDTDSDPYGLAMTTEGTYVYFESELDAPVGSDAIIHIDPSHPLGGANRFSVLATEAEMIALEPGFTGTPNLGGQDIAVDPATNDVYALVTNFSADGDPENILVRIPNLGGTTYGPVELAASYAVMGAGDQYAVAIDRRPDPNEVVMIIDNDDTTSDSLSNGNGLYVRPLGSSAPNVPNTLIANFGDLGAGTTPASVGGTDSIGFWDVAFVGDEDYILHNTDVQTSDGRDGDIVLWDVSAGSASIWAEGNVYSESYSPLFTMDDGNVAMLITATPQAPFNDDLIILSPTGQYIQTIAIEDDMLAEMNYGTDLAVAGNRAFTSDGNYTFALMTAFDNETLLEILPLVPPAAVEGSWALYY